MCQFLLCGTCTSVYYLLLVSRCVFCRDLKRDIAKKLSRLDNRTQRAIAELTRDRIMAEQGGEDLASAVTAAEEEKNDSDSD